jgi:hypothetical protein
MCFGKVLVVICVIGCRKVVLVICVIGVGKVLLVIGVICCGMVWESFASLNKNLFKD